MALLRFDSVSLAFGAKPLLSDVSFNLEPKERVCLLGRNGEGKSSFLKILLGQIHPDSGERWVDPAIKIGELQQEVPMDVESVVYDVVAGGLPEAGDLLKQYHALVQKEMTDDDLARLEKVQHKLEAIDGWALNTKVENIISRLKLDANARMSDLSGGWKRRVLLARALVASPDVLVLDEPTNHLDIPAILWLEEQIKSFEGSVVFVSHDRSFIRNMSTRIIELDRGNLSSWPGNYDQYLISKQKQLEDEEKHNALFDKRLSEEEVWIRQGIKARRTRNEGRVRSLEKMRDERKQRIGRQGKVNIKLETGEASGKLVAEIKDLALSFDESLDKCVIKGFSSTILRGDRIGFIGENGCGKTTLVKLILGQLAASDGSVKIGTNLEVAYFDQLRTALDLEKSVVDNVADGYEFIEIAGKRQHVIGYLNDFLFTAERARSPVKALSGGEKNRLLLAKLFSKPSNLLVLDEPTNDLDIETLELLEESVSKYDGTILLISHDRAFIDSICTSTFAFEGNGRVAEYVGGYDDWVRQGKGFPSLRDNRSVDIKADVPQEKAGSKVSGDVVKNEKSPKIKKLSYKLKLELEQLPEKIAALEASQAALNEQVNAPNFYSQPREIVDAALEELSGIDEALSVAMDRWVELEEMSGS